MYYIIIFCTFSGKNDFITAIYVIFLGVLPAIALFLFGIWYVRNSGQHWKKDVMSTYVSSLDRFKKKRKPHANKSLDVSTSNTSKTHYTAGSKFFGWRIIISAYFTPKKKNASRNTNNKIFTISDNVSLKESLQITKTDLISTTNPDAIKCSNNIEYRKSLLFGNVKPDVSTKPQTNEVYNKIATFSVPAVEVQSKKITPLKSELSSKISERIQQIQKRSSKNDKGFTLNTDIKFEHLNESPASTSNIISKMPDVFNNSKKPAPFYNKKPPPPPAPAQSLKPKI